MEHSPYAATQDAGKPPTTSPLRWIPTLYFAQGLPFFVVMAISVVMYKNLGVSNDDITYWTSAIGLAWVFKPAWSPLLEAFKSKKKIVVLFQMVGAATMGLCAFAVQTPSFFFLTIALLAVIAIAAATHDIACDGLYIMSLNSTEQAKYAGWLGAFFNGAKLFATGGMLWLAGYLEKVMGVKPAWGVIFAVLGGLMFLLALYHTRALPDTRAAGSQESDKPLAEKIPVLDVLLTFFQKPGIWFAIAFILLFRLGEGQINAVGQLFLKDALSAGGLGLDTTQIATVYGIAGTVSFVAGSILGGYFAAWLGLKRAMFFLILAMNLPNIVFYLLAVSQTANFTLVMVGLSIESFGYGFGFVGLVLFMMQVVSVGKYQTAHYALATGIMQLGLLAPRAISGKLQLMLGYQDFFLWVVLSAIPVLVLSLFIPDKAASTSSEGNNGKAVSA